MRKAAKVPLPPVRLNGFKTFRGPTLQLKIREARRKQQSSRKSLIASKRERGSKHRNLTQVKAQ